MSSARVKKSGHGAKENSAFGYSHLLRWANGPDWITIRSVNERDQNHFTAVAKTTVSNWFDKSGEAASLRAPLLRGVTAFMEEVQRRDHWSECQTIILGDASAPALLASARRSRITPCKDGLAVSTIVPGWGFGWSKVLRDEYVCDTLSWFGYYARQYIHRSEVAKALMIAWETQSAILHPFGSRGSSWRYSPATSIVSTRVALDAAVSDIAREWGAPTAVPRPSRSRWLRRNTLDPAIHQGIFHFLRAQKLMAAEFEIEAIVALDCVIEAVQSMHWSVPGTSPRNSRAALYAALALRPRSIALADHIYFLRNEFGAHAGGWRWWDVGVEVDDDLLMAASCLAHTIIRRAADLEPQHRQFDPHPVRWADWLFEHFPQIWRVTWFK